MNQKDLKDIPYNSCEEDYLQYEIVDHFKKGQIDVFFRDHADHLVEKIKESDGVIGCVAWLTNNQVLDALKEKEASIVVQKEDFLRPDMKKVFRNDLRKKYEVIKPLTYRCLTNGHGISCHSDPPDEAIRCAGIKPKNSTIYPRMHHKFFVFLKKILEEPSVCTFCKAEFLGYHAYIRHLPCKNTDDENQDLCDVLCEQGICILCTKCTVEFSTSHDYIRHIPRCGMSPYDPYSKKIDEKKQDLCYVLCEQDILRKLDNYTFEPYAVWTGSYNPTETGEKSFENVVYIEDAEIAYTYLNQFLRISLLSEPLDWKSEYIQPEYRIGS